jgi:CheY-like chemotaxis protein
VYDVDAVRRMLTRMLTLGGYAVLEAADGLEALELIRRQDGQVDLVVSDVLMPGMNGTELAGRLLHEFPGSRIVLISAYIPDGRAMVGLPSHEVPLIRKPIAHAELMQAIEEGLARPAPVPV